MYRYQILIALKIDLIGIRTPCHVRSAPLHSLSTIRVQKVASLALKVQPTILLEIYVQNNAQAGSS